MLHFFFGGAGAVGMDRCPRADENGCIQRLKMVKFYVADKNASGNVRLHAQDTQKVAFALVFIRRGYIDIGRYNLTVYTKKMPERERDSGENA